MVKCLCLQQLWPCTIPRAGLEHFLNFSEQFLEIPWRCCLLLVFCSDGCHLNASPNEPKPDICQLHDGFWAARHNATRVIFPTSTFRVGGGVSLCTLALASLPLCTLASLPLLMLLTSCIPTPTVVFSYA